MDSYRTTRWTRQTRPTCGVRKTVTVSGTDGRRRLGELFVGVLQAVTTATRCAGHRLKLVRVHSQLVATCTRTYNRRSLPGRRKQRHDWYPSTPPLPSNRHRRSNSDCLGGKRENYRVCSVQYVRNNCAQCNAHTYERT